MTLPQPYYRTKGRQSWKFLEPEGIYTIIADFATTKYRDYRPFVGLNFRPWNADKQKYGYQTGKVILQLEVGQEAIILDTWAHLVQEWPDPVKRQRILDALKVAAVL